MNKEIRRFAAELGTPPPSIPPGEALVLLTVGESAYVATVLHPMNGPLVMPAARIAEQAGLPVNELPGRRFAVTALSETDVDGFTLLDDPRL